MALVTKYLLALSSENMTDFLSGHAFIITVSEGDTPAKQQGMFGEYYILEFADWTQDCMTSLFDKNEEMRGKPKDILVMKDGVVRQYHFENAIGVNFGVKEIDPDERMRINMAYKDWKEHNK